MPDGQDKSDDLIAELAKLMASNAQGAEPEANPAPKLVTLADAPKPEGPGPAMVRIPGMDSPVASTPTPAVGSPVPPVDRPAPIAPGVLRIPGMDQPVAASPARPVFSPAPVVTSPTPAPVASSPAPSAAAAESRPGASFDFGTLPPAASTSFKPEPMANWQDREIPQAGAVCGRRRSLRRLAPVARPVVARGAGAGAPGCRSSPPSLTAPVVHA
jgi:hypothetical protein